MTTVFKEGVVTFSDEELRKYRQYMYWSSGVICYDKSGKFIADPFNEFPQSYTVDLTKDRQSLLYDLSSHYVMSFPEPSEREVLELLNKGIKEVKYNFDNIPWSDSEYHYCGSFVLAE